MNTVRLPESPATGAFVLRVALGLMWLSHAIVLKVMTFGMTNLAAWLGTQGFSPLLAYPLVAAEVIGGVLILVGFHGRWASGLLLPVLIGAITVHAGNGWVFTSPNGGWEYPLFLVAASLAHFFVGDGALALRPTAGSMPALSRSPQARSA